MLLILRCCLLLAVLSCVQPKQGFQRDGVFVSLDDEFNRRVYAQWPSVHNAVTLLRIRRAAQMQAPETPVATDILGASEGGSPVIPPDGSTNHSLTPVQALSKNSTNSTEDKSLLDIEVRTKNSTKISNETPKEKIQNVTAAPTVSTTNITMKDNGTTAEKAAKEWDLSPEATKRGLIVFGGFALLAMAYFIFYRTKRKYNEAGNPNGSNENNQFRYGVLQSDDRRDNLELSRVPLTMESDEEEDEDLEIFDLEQKKKSLSYVNLQGTDEDIVLAPNSNVRDQLLLDIEDENNDTLINWTNSGNKALL